jgi:hypothetical protein
MEDGGLLKSTYSELTDEECFRQTVESFVEMRSESERRKIPRFPTPVALSEQLSVPGFEGLLICRDDDSFGSCAGNSPEPIGLSLTGERIRRIKIVDFCEGGLQLRVSSNDLLRFQGRSLCLEVENFRLPMRLNWCTQSGLYDEGGFSFIGRIDSDPYLARFVSALNKRLIEFLSNHPMARSASFSRQAGVFLFFAIYFALRLQFLEMVSEINQLTSTAAAEYPSAALEFILQTFQGLDYTSSYHRQQISKNISNPRLKRLLHIYMQPYYSFGCGLRGRRQKIIFLKDDAWTAILDSIFFVESDCEPSTDILPSIQPLYRCFLNLRQLLPGVFDAKEFDDQFKYYSRTIFDMEMLRERVVNYLSDHGARIPSFAEKSSKTGHPDGNVLPECHAAPAGIVGPTIVNVPRTLLVLLTAVMVAAASFLCGLWLERSTGKETSTPHIEHGASPQTRHATQPSDGTTLSSGGTVSPSAGEWPSQPKQVGTNPGTLTLEQQGPTASEGAGAKPADEDEYGLKPAGELKRHLFEIEAHQPAWVQVEIDGKNVYSVLMRPGEKREWEAEQNMRIVVGNAGGVSIKWDGINLAPVGKLGQPVRFHLPDPKLIPAS